LDKSSDDTGNVITTCHIARRLWARYIISMWEYQTSGPEHKTTAKQLVWLPPRAATSVLGMHVRFSRPRLTVPVRELSDFQRTVGTTRVEMSMRTEVQLWHSTARRTKQRRRTLSMLTRKWVHQVMYSQTPHLDQHQPQAHYTEPALYLWIKYQVCN